MSSKISPVPGTPPAEVRQGKSGGRQYAASELEGAPRSCQWPRVSPLLFLLALAVRLTFLPIAPNATTDAASRLHNAQLWLQNPTQLPPATSSDAWLPLHFWLLGSVLYVAHSEIAARAFTSLLAALTVVFYAAILARCFGAGIARASSLVLALFGFHIAFSITTGSEVPTISFLAVGIYGWIRYTSEESWRWLLLSALAFGAASLCRFEAWLVPPVLSLTMLDFSRGWSSLFSSAAHWRKALRFAVFACSGSIGWLVFSFLKWGDPLELPHRTVWLNAHFRPAVLHHSMVFRLLTVPGSLLISLSPLVAVLACVGLGVAIVRGSKMTRSLAFVVLVLLAFNWWNSLRYEVTQARYTLLYGWLLIPFAFEAVCWITQRWRWAASQATFAAVIILFVLWQAGIVLGARYAPPSIADRLGVMSPVLPLHHEMRALTNWLKLNSSSYHAVILDDFNWESAAIARFGELDPTKTWGVTAQDYADPARLNPVLKQFIAQLHPDLAISSPDGLLGRAWSVDNRQSMVVEDFGIQLDLEWQGEHWRIYKISYPPTSPSNSTAP